MVCRQGICAALLGVLVVCCMIAPLAPKLFWSSATLVDSSRNETIKVQSSLWLTCNTTVGSSEPRECEKLSKFTFNSFKKGVVKMDATAELYLTIAALFLGTFVSLLASMCSLCRKKMVVSFMYIFVLIFSICAVSLYLRYKFHTLDDRFGTKFRVEAGLYVAITGLVLSLASVFAACAIVRKADEYEVV